jgi:hypothetical protein
LDDILEALMGKRRASRSRPGAKIAFLKEWELIGPLGEANALNDIVRAPETLRYRLLAHLVGMGGAFELPRDPLKGEVQLEELGREDATTFLPPVFRLVTRRIHRVLLGDLTVEGPRSLVEGVFRPIEDAWVAEIGLEQLEGLLDVREDLIVVRAGWEEPAKHVVGLVYAREGEKHILYASNTGEQGESGRVIQKLEIRDLPLFREFLRKSAVSPDEVREIWAPRLERLGLVPASKGEQIPEEFSRARQKRDNAPMAARKACQLAMLWSVGRRQGLTSAQVRSLYKMTTTGIRMEGVGAALRDGNAEFLSRVFVALLSKWDRPDCRRLVFRVGDRLLESHGLDPVSYGVTDTLPFKSLAENPHVDWIRMTVQACGLNLEARDSQGKSLQDYAKEHGNTEVVNLLRKLRG